MKIYDIAMANSSFLLVKEQGLRIDGTAPAEVRAFQFFQMLDNATGLDPVPLESKGPNTAAQLEPVMNWTTILANAGIPDSPGRLEAIAATKAATAAKQAAKAAKKTQPKSTKKK